MFSHKGLVQTLVETYTLHQKYTATATKKEIIFSATIRCWQWSGNKTWGFLPSSKLLTGTYWQSDEATQSPADLQQAKRATTESRRDFSHYRNRDSTDHSHSMCRYLPVPTSSSLACLRDRGIMTQGSRSHDSEVRESYTERQVEANTSPPPPIPITLKL